MEKMTKQELIDWINFQYEDLLNYRISIGGYYFTFDQIKDFLIKKRSLEKRISRVNHEINVVNTLIGKPTLKDRTTALELTSQKLKQQADFITDTVPAINKHSEHITLPVTYEEFMYVFTQLTFMREELECYKDFLLEEIEHVKDGDENNFFIFINDLLEDVKKQYSGEVVIQKIDIKIPLNK